MSNHEIKAISFAIVGEGDDLFEGEPTIVEVVDTGSHAKIKQTNQTVRVDRYAWPSLKEAIDKLFNDWPDDY